MEEEIDSTFIEGVEGKYQYGVPTAGSGVTVGTGVDIGQISLKELKDRGIPESIIEKICHFTATKNEDGTFSPLIGERAEAAKKQHNIALSHEEMDILTSKTMQYFVRTLEIRFSKANPDIKFKDLPKSVKTILFSVMYHYGSGSKLLAKLIEVAKHGDFAKMASILRNTNDWFKTRREKEADYLMRPGDPTNKQLPKAANIVAPKTAPSIAKSTAKPPQINLHRGQSSKEVGELQDYLVEKGLMKRSALDKGGRGHYGPKTQESIGKLQEEYVSKGLMKSEDLKGGGKGVFGPKTRAAMQADKKNSMQSKPINTKGQVQRNLQAKIQNNVAFHVGGFVGGTLGSAIANIDHAVADPKGYLKEVGKGAAISGAVQLISTKVPAVGCAVTSFIFGYEGAKTFSSPSLSIQEKWVSFGKSFFTLATGLAAGLGGMWAGAQAGAALGAATGPGLFFTGLLGGIIGGFVGTLIPRAWNRPLKLTSSEFEDDGRLPTICKYDGWNPELDFDNVPADTRSFMIMMYADKVIWWVGNIDGKVRKLCAGANVGDTFISYSGMGGVNGKITIQLFAMSVDNVDVKSDPNKGNVVGAAQMTCYSP